MLELAQLREPAFLSHALCVESAPLLLPLINQSLLSVLTLLLLGFERAMHCILLRPFPCSDCRVVPMNLISESSANISQRDSDVVVNGLFDAQRFQGRGVLSVAAAPLAHRLCKIYDALYELARLYQMRHFHVSSCLLLLQGKIERCCGIDEAHKLWDQVRVDIGTLLLVGEFRRVVFILAQ